MSQEPETDLTVEGRLAACSETARVLFALIEKTVEVGERHLVTPETWRGFGFQDLADFGLIAAEGPAPDGRRAWRRITRIAQIMETYLPIVRTQKVVRS